MTEPFWDTLHRWATSAAGLHLSDRQMAQLRIYLDTLLFWNRKMALVSQHDPTEIAFRHLADSLFAAAHCPDGGAVVDLGSGAGLPGLVIAVTRPNSPVCLVESRAKKTSFLFEAVRATGAANATIFHGRIEQAATHPDHAGRYRVAIARALCRTEEFLRMAKPFLGEGGVAIAMKSVREAPPPFAGGCTQTSYELPDGTPRSLLVFRLLAAPQHGDPVSVTHP